MALSGEVLDSLEAVESRRSEWDALAETLGCPYSAPAWGLAWFRHVAPAGSELRVVAAVEGERLVGIAPFCVEPSKIGLPRYRLLASDTSPPVEPLAERGREREAAAVFAAALAGADPAPSAIVFGGTPAALSWPGMLAAGWPGRRPWLARELSLPAPSIEARDRSYEDWFAGKSSHFRKRLRRSRRQLDEDGGTFRLTRDVGELDRDLAAFIRLHHARWDRRGGSSALDPAVERMLGDAARELLPQGRLGLLTLEVAGEPVAVELFLEAGTTLSFWLGGFDEAWSDRQPSLHAMLSVIEESRAGGTERYDLGPGPAEYKRRLADGEETIDWVTLLPHGPRYPLARARLAPLRLRRRISRRLPRIVRLWLRRRPWRH